VGSTHQLLELSKPVTVEPLALVDRPHTEVKAEVESEVDATSRWTGEPVAPEAPRDTAPQPPPQLSMARVTASLQLLLAARRAERIARRFD
jgi:hypothetical protein